MFIIVQFSCLIGNAGSVCCSGYNLSFSAHRFILKHYIFKILNKLSVDIIVLSRQFT